MRIGISWPEVYYGMSPKQAVALLGDLYDCTEEANRPPSDDPAGLLGMVI